MTYEQRTSLKRAPGEVVAASARGLEGAGFWGVQIDEAAMTIRARKRHWTQWAPSEVVLRVEAAPYGCDVVVGSDALGQSIGALVSPPARALVTQAIKALHRACPS